jgi:hypothetical protein
MALVLRKSGTEKRGGMELGNRAQRAAHVQQAKVYTLRRYGVFLSFAHDLFP